MKYMGKKILGIYIFNIYLSSDYINYRWLKFIDVIKSNNYCVFDGRIMVSYWFHSQLKFDFSNPKRYLLWTFSVELGFVGFIFTYWHKKLSVAE